MCEQLGHIQLFIINIGLSARLEPAAVILRFQMNRPATMHS